MQVYCRSTFNNAGTAMSQHWFITMCLLCLLRSRSALYLFNTEVLVGPYDADSFVAYVPDINTILGLFLVAHATHTMYVNSTLVYRCPV